MVDSNYDEFLKLLNSISAKDARVDVSNYQFKIHIYFYKDPQINLSRLIKDGYIKSWGKSYWVGYHPDIIEYEIFVREVIDSDINPTNKSYYLDELLEFLKVVSVIKNSNK